MKKSADIHHVRGFVVESGVIQPVEATVKDVVTDCLDVRSGEQTICWHKKFYNIFRDPCLNCDSLCEAYSEETRPAYGKLVRFKRLKDGNLFIQNKAAVKKELFKIYKDIPSTNCTNCGKCCRIPVELYSIEYIHILEYIKNYFSAAELKRIKGLCSMEVAIEKKGLTDRRRCIFRDEENRRCSIYEVRPIGCREYKCENVEWIGDSSCRQKKSPPKQKKNLYKRIFSLTDNLFIIQKEEIIISGKNEMNRWFLL